MSAGASCQRSPPGPHYSTWQSQTAGPGTIGHRNKHTQVGGDEFSLDRQTRRVRNIIDKGHNSNINVFSLLMYETSTTEVNKTKDNPLDIRALDVSAGYQCEKH